MGTESVSQDTTSQIKTLRARRLAEEISGTLLARAAGFDRSRLSFIENLHVQPTDDELERLSVALGRLIVAKQKVQRVAAEVGWPIRG